MKLEFLDDITDTNQNKDVFFKQLIRLYHFNANEALRLSELINTTIIEKESSLDLGNVDFIEAINCSLQLKLSNSSFGIKAIDTFNFNCYLTKEDFLIMIERIKQFSKVELNEYQWLYDIDTPIELLFSPNGTW
jgi:hypothetical protein